MELGTLHVFDDGQGADRGLAELAVRLHDEARAERGRFRLGLSGGPEAVSFFEQLAGPAFAARFDWSAVEILFADDRAVAADDPASNYGSARRHLLEQVGIPESNVHRWRGEADDLEAAAREYEPHLALPIDLLVLGVGADGHTCSLFPHSPLLTEYGRRAGAVFDAPAPPPRRLTITPLVIGEARRVAILVKGRRSAAVLPKALSGPTPFEDVPAVLLRPYEWFIDREAASDLSFP